MGKIADTVKALRTARGLTQAQFGDLFEPPVEQSTVVRWEKGSTPKPAYLAQIAALAGMTMEELAGVGDAQPGAPLNPLNERVLELLVRLIAHELDVGQRTINERAPQLAQELVSVSAFLLDPETRQNYPLIEDFFREKAPEAFPRRAQGI